MRKHLGADLGLDDPVHLRLERLDLVMALHTEAQSWCLARAERDEGGVQIPIFTLEVLGLEPGKEAFSLILKAYWSKAG